MATKKGGAAPLQVDVGTDEDWDSLLNREGLLVIDAYADWCGPCSGMAGNLKKIKMELGGDRLTLVTAHTERIAALGRFRGRSEPAWLLVSRGQLLAVLLGADPPRLAREVTKQLRHLTKVNSGEESLQSIPWDKLTEEEEARLAAAEARKKRAEMLEKIRQEAEKRKKKAEQLAPFVEPLKRHTVVVFLPTVVKDGRASKVVEGLRGKWRKIRLRVRQQGKMQVTAEMGSELFWERKLPQHEQVIECLQSGPSLVLLVERLPVPKPPPESPKPLAEEPPTEEHNSASTPTPATTPGPEGDLSKVGEPPLQEPSPAPPLEEEEEDEEEEEEEEDVESVVANLLYGFVPVMPPDDIEQAHVPPSAADICYGWVGTAISGRTVEEEPEEGETTEEDMPLLQPAIDSAASALLIRREDSSPVLPGLWTPLTALSKVSAVRALYPSTAERLCAPESEGAVGGVADASAAPLPPVVVLLFDSETVPAVDAALTSLATSEEACEDVVKRAWTEASTSQGGEQRLALAITADAADTLAALRAVGPVYVSLDADTGAVDIGFYFTPESEAKAELGTGAA